MNTLAYARKKILDKLPSDLRPMVEMYFDFYQEMIVDELVNEMLADARQLDAHGVNKVLVADLKVWALTKKSKMGVRYDT